MLGAWNDYYIDQTPLPNPYAESAKPLFANGFTAWVLFSATRFIMGVAILLALKIIIKASIKTLANFFEEDHAKDKKIGKKTTDRGANQIFTLPYLFTCYGTIGYGAVYIAPKAFEFVGLIH